MEPKPLFPTWPVDAARPSARAECAALAVFELALERPTGRPTSARKIAEKYGLSERFLTQILQRLRRFGVVETARGSFGGFRLIADPAELTLGFVVAAAETQPPKSEKAESQERELEPAASSARRRKIASAPSGNAEIDATRALFDRAWRDAETKRQEFLNAILISELIEAARKTAPVNFTI